MNSRRRRYSALAVISEERMSRALPTSMMMVSYNSLAFSMPPERKDQFQTISGRPIERLYTADDIPNFDYAAELGDPGIFPFTRGIHATGYRTKLWTMRQFAGFGSPADTNNRYRELLDAGATGLSVAFDLPSLMGLDADHPLAAGEVGKCGVNITSLADMETLFDRIPLG